MKTNVSIWLMLAGLGFSSLLALRILVRYPGDAFSLRRNLIFGLIGIFVPLGVAACVVVFGFRFSRNEYVADRKSGTVAGLIAGCLWVLEISFNNFIDPRVSTGAARFVVDNTTWGLVAFAMLAASFAQTLNTRDVGAGVRTGVWSGLLSGLIACVMGLLLVTVWMRFLLRDPLNIGEYAARGAAEHASDMATYFAYDVMSGALGHLIVLGIVMGALLGLSGALLARLLLFVRRKS